MAQATVTLKVDVEELHLIQDALLLAAERLHERSSWSNHKDRIDKLQSEKERKADRIKAEKFEILRRNIGSK